MKKIIVLTGFLIAFGIYLHGQASRKFKKISPDLFGLFFEDINYSADGGLYAELVQNRSFEYNPTERKEWNPFSFWEYLTPGYSYGAISVETSSPVHINNPHYITVSIEYIGHYEQNTGESGVGIRNSGFNGMVINKGARYNFSMQGRLLSSQPVALTVSLQTPKGKIIAESPISVSSNNWCKYVASLESAENCDSANLVILATQKGKIAMDVISLFPENTFKNRTNGLREDLAQLLADVQPKFIRFPGGCLSHGDGVGNMYRWKNTIGPIEERKEQRNIWGYHQTMGLGYFEYFQFCEDIGAKPLPVLPAGVSCQNSGGTWRIGGTGQQCIPMDEMKEYIQEVLDLIEWANGPADSKWGSLRAKAGHPASFHLEYIGIGNEDKITPEFEERFSMIYQAMKSQHPEIKVVGTAGPFYEGEDFEKGWKLARKLEVPVVDEHYYTDPSWFMHHQTRYDAYERNKTQVYLGEYASWGNKLKNALGEAMYMTALERNGDVVRLASYAPLLAKKYFTQWNTDMIFFDNVSACPTPNYYVQKLFSTNQGDQYINQVFTYNAKDTALAVSSVRDSKSGDIVIKIVNMGLTGKVVKANLGGLGNPLPEAAIIVLSGQETDENTIENPLNVIPKSSTIKISKIVDYTAPAMSMSVIRIKIKK